MDNSSPDAASAAAQAAHVQLQRAHHVAFVVKDPGATRQFYEDIIGLPLIATWTEAAEIRAFPGRQVEYCHVFFGLADGSALAFFAFADDDVYEAISPKIENGFTHIAISATRGDQDNLKARLDAHGMSSYFIDHGYCLSLYVNDPDGMTLEFTSEPQDGEQIWAWQAETCHETLTRWLSGDREPNNHLAHR